jgi:acetyl esterase/lipase
MNLRCLALNVLILGTVPCATHTSVDASATPTPPPSTTYTYKTVGNLPIKLDVYRPNDDIVRPVAMWIHGGALIMGSRRDALPAVAELLLQAGFAVVSIDYRLAPETKLPEIIQDVDDAYAFVRVRGPSLFKVRTDKMAVIGASAGGYLALTLGFRANPRPAVLVSLYGYGDLVGDWYSKPSDFYRTTASLVSEADARRVVGREPLSDASLSLQRRYLFYFYTRQTGRWANEVAGWDPRADGAKFVPFMPIKNIAKTYPPPMLIHGDVDTDVPYEQAVMLDNELRLHSVTHELITIKNGDHFLRGGDPSAVSRAQEDAAKFVIRHMN